LHVLRLRRPEAANEGGYTQNGAPEIRGYAREYLEASSPRSRQIREHPEEESRW
jgi:hypothetical protein